MRKPKIRLFVGGPDFHPAKQQAELVQKWFGKNWKDSQLVDGRDCFLGLDDCDLLVMVGGQFTYQKDGGMEYLPLEKNHLEGFRRYVASGKPLLLHHASVASYNDTPEFGALLGIQWIWGETTHPAMAEYCMRVQPTGHPVVAGLEDYVLYDELYYKLKIDSSIHPETHATAWFDGQKWPMLITGQGGRGVDGAGKVAYICNGHDLRATDTPAMKKIWGNSIQWLLT
ncbi:ThuA domain-containing protein [Oscillatoria amoena NRMC-F 0135]|nr:ThuA domain-containing protein [Oscillatoria laete-virens]MDL5048185.1 ThuA domain-containing protein [Oscillatoria amoena NRMC-F 0135]MDL5053078.1 ThuA domain-containing protein [Oscillatoria laete-virens NRMC-F 0139]